MDKNRLPPPRWSTLSPYGRGWCAAPGDGYLTSGVTGEQKVFPALWKLFLSYCKLARMHRPWAIWILLFPAWCGLMLASSSFPSHKLFVLFGIGAFLMRSAGCVYNDIIDRKFDKHVKRTALRPLATGEIPLKGAWMWLGVLLGLAGAILLTLPLSVIGVGILTLFLVLLYPWMKRVTYWPQLFLGITFNMGMVMGWISASSSLSLALFCFYGGAILWTLGYDTIYALQDVEDDVRVGVKSSALVVSSFLRPFLASVYGGALILWGIGGILSCLREGYWICWGIIALHFAWQIFTLKKGIPLNCLHRFNANSLVGALLFAGLVFSRLIH